MSDVFICITASPVGQAAPPIHTPQRKRELFSLKDFSAETIGGHGTASVLPEDVELSRSHPLRSTVRITNIMIRCAVVGVRPSAVREHRAVARPGRGAVGCVIRRAATTAPRAKAQRATLQRRRVLPVSSAASSPAAATSTAKQEGGPLRVIVVGAPGSGKGTQVRISTRMGPPAAFGWSKSCQRQLFRNPRGRTVRQVSSCAAQGGLGCV